MCNKLQSYRKTSLLLVCNLIVETRCILLEADEFDARNKPDFNVRNESRLKLIADHEHSYFAFSLKNERNLSNKFSKQILLHTDSYTSVVILDVTIL